MTVRLRPFTAEVAAPAWEIEKRCFPDPWSEKGLAEGFGSPWQYALAAEKDGQLAGYLFAQTAADEGELVNLAVSPDARRLGIGEVLLARMLRENEKVRLWRLDVRCGNAAARRLYEKTGFRVVTRNKNYYTDPPEDGYLMMYLSEKGAADHAGCLSCGDRRDDAAALPASDRTAGAP